MVEFVASKLAVALFGAAATTATAVAVSTAIAQIGLGLILNAAARALAPKAKAEDLARELQQPQGLPPYRFVYGETEAPGSPAPADFVKSGILYGCWLVNSRPSEGPFTLYLDKRKVELTGDPYDFSEGGGATATNAPFAGYLKVWIGRGDQLGPPADILSEAPYTEGSAETGFQSSDGWRGSTVVWLRLDRGPNATRSERWPATPPAVSLRGKFSRLWDPRDVAQDPDDPSTWVWSDNQALMVLDALMRNPVAPYALRNVLIETFEWAADVADETVTLRAGGSEARYRAGGVLTFSESELEDQLEPLLDAGGSRPLRVAGRFGILPATWHAPVYTLTDLVGSSYEFSAVRAGDALYRRVRTTYTSADRGYESADLGLYDVPGVTASTRVFDQQLPFVQSGSQAQRLRKIQAVRLSMQRELRGVAPPDMVNVLPGAHIDVALPDRGRMNGAYMVLSQHPAMDLLGDDGGVALRVPFEVEETAPEIFAWDPVTDEELVIAPDFDEEFSGIAAPGPLSVQFGSSVDLDLGSGFQQRLRFSFDPSPTPVVTYYEWQYRDWSVEAAGSWVPGGAIPSETRDGAGEVFGYLQGLPAYGTATGLRVRAATGSGASDWVVQEGIYQDFAVVENSSVAEPGRAVFDLNTPDNSVFAGVRVYRSAPGAGFAAALLVKDTVALSLSATHQLTVGDVTAINEVSDAGFDAPGDWSGADWTVAGGLASHVANGGGDGLYTTPVSGALADGETYRWTLNVAAVSADGVKVAAKGDSNITEPASKITAAGTYQGTLVAPANADEVGVYGFGGFVGDIDALWLVRETPDCLPQGPGDYWLVPVTTTGIEGPETGPITLSIP